jgi:hypothetical protein
MKFFYLFVLEIMRCIRNAVMYIANINLFSTQAISFIQTQNVAEKKSEYEILGSDHQQLRVRIA